MTTEREVTLRKHFGMAHHIANMLITNSSIAQGVIADNKSLVSFQTIKLEEQTKELLEYIRVLGNSKEDSQ